MDEDMWRLWFTKLLLVALLLCSVTTNAQSKTDEDATSIDQEEISAQRIKRDLQGVTTVLLVSARPGKSAPPVGLLTKTARTFVQDGASTEFATQIHGTTLDNGRLYARILSTSSRVFYDKEPTPDPPSPFLIYPSKAPQDDWQFKVAPITAIKEIDTLKRVGNEKSVPEEDQQAKFSESSSTKLDELSRENDIFSKRELNDESPKVKPAKIRPADNLPTYTVKHEYVTSGFDFDDEEPKSFKPRVPKIFKPQPKVAPQKKPDLRSLATVTYHGFADFTTTVGDTVIVFSPSTSPAPVGRPATTIKGDATLRPDDGIAVMKIKPTSVIPQIKTEEPTRQLQDHVKVNHDAEEVGSIDSSIQPSVTEDPELEASTRSTDPLLLVPDIESGSLKPTGLLRVIDSTTSLDGTTTHYKSLIYGTYLGTNYAQIIHTSSNVYFFPEEATASYTIDDGTVEYDTTTASTDAEEQESTTEMTTGTTPQIITTTEDSFSDANELTTPFRDTTDNVLTTLKDILESARKVLETTESAVPTVDDDLANDIVPGDPQGRSIKDGSSKNILGIQNNKGIEQVLGSQQDKVTIATRLVPSTVYKTFTYFTTFFIPGENDQTTTSVRSREVISSELSLSSELFVSTISETPILPTASIPFGNTRQPTNIAYEVDEEQTTKQDEEIELIFKTLYTTYTYLTTFFQENSSSISSREVVETNVITQTVGPNGVSDVASIFEKDEPASIIPTKISENMATSITTPSPTVKELEENEESLLGTTEEGLTTLQDMDTTVKEPFTTESSTTDDDEDDDEEVTVIEPSPTPVMSTEALKEQVKTYYTTYTYFTTIFVDDETEIETRTEVFSNVVTESIQPTSVIPVPQETKSPEAKTTDKPAVPPEILAYLEALKRQKSQEEALRLAKKVQEENSAEEIDKTETTTEENRETTTDYPTTLEDQFGTDRSSRNFMVNAQVTPNPPVDGEVLGSMITDVVSSSSSGGGTVLNGMDKRNAVPEDQELSESNHHDVEPAPTLLLQTSYTTFTYFTTMYKGDASNVVSRLETVTNIVTETIRPSAVLSVETSTLPVTYFTTFTYWTTFYKGGDTVTTSREETISNIVTPGVSPTPTVQLDVVMTYTPTVDASVTNEEPVISNEPKLTADNEVTPSDLLPEKATTEESKIVTEPGTENSLSSSSTISPEPTTFYTTYTYFTTSYIGNETVVNSRLETVTSVSQADTTIQLATGRAIGGPVPGIQDLGSEIKSTSTSKVSELPKTGLLSTMRSSQVHDGTTTHFATDLYGTYIDGLYAQVVESSTSLETQLLPSSSTTSSTPVLPTGLLSLNKGSVIDADEVTTVYFTTKQIGTLIDGLYAKVIESTSTTKIDEEKKSTIPPVQGHRTGLVRLIQGQIENNGTTTFYQSKVIGTSIEGRYAQIIESTSTFLSSSPTQNIAPSSTSPPTKPTDVPEISPSPAVIQSSLSEEPTTEPPEQDEESEQNEEHEEEDEEDEDDQSSTKKSRLTFSTRKRTFTPVIRPFASRNRPTFNPKRKGAQGATIITRTDITPTITATLAGKGNRFASSRGRVSSPIGPYSSTLSSSGSRRFSGRRGSTINPSSLSSSTISGSTRGRQASRITPSSANRRGPSSIRGSSRISPRGSSSVHPAASSRYRPGIRPSSTLLRGQTSLRHDDQDDEANEFTTTTLVTEETPYTDDTEGGETVTAPLTTTTESSRRSTNPLLRFRRPLNYNGAARSNTTPKPPTTTPRRSSNFNRQSPPTIPSRARTNNRVTVPVSTRPRQGGQGLFPPRGLFGRKQEVPVDEEEDEELEEEDDENFEEDPVEEITDNDYEGSEHEDRRSGTTVNSNRRIGKAINPVQIRPFGSFTRSRRVRRQASQLRSLTNRFRRPSPSSSAKPEEKAPATDSSTSKEDTSKPSKPTSRYNSRGRTLTTSRPSGKLSSSSDKSSETTENTNQSKTRTRTKPSNGSGSRSNSRVKASPVSSSGRQFTLREKESTSSRSTYKRPSSTSSRTTSRPDSGRLRPARYRSSSAKPQTDSKRVSSPRTSSRSSNRNGNSRKSTQRGRGSYEDLKDTSMVQQDNDGTITVTHYIPTEVTIPVVNNGVTEHRNVITAQPSTEVIGPNQYSTVTGGDGKPLVVIVSEITGTNNQGQMELTRFLLHETPTTRVSHTLSTINGRRVSQSVIVPSTIYSVENVVSTVQPSLPTNAPLANILLSQLLLGQLGQQNPLLQPQATPTTQYNTRTTSYVTTITKHQSTVIPLTFRGKEILTTLVDSSTDVITATEFITDTVVVTPTAAALPAANLNSLLLLLQQPQQAQPQQQNHLLDPLFAAAPLLTQSNTLPGEVERRHQPADSDYKPVSSEYSDEESEEVSFEKPSKHRKNRVKNERKEESSAAPKAESSVVTLYVSGRRPGEFSTILSTVRIGDEASVSRRRRDIIENVVVRPSIPPSLHAAPEPVTLLADDFYDTTNYRGYSRRDYDDNYESSYEPGRVDDAEEYAEETPRKRVRIRVPVVRSRTGKQHKLTVVKRRPIATYSSSSLPEEGSHTPRRVVVTRIRSRLPVNTINDDPDVKLYDSMVQELDNTPRPFGRHKVTITRRRKLQPITSSPVKKVRITRKRLVNVRPLQVQPTPTISIITAGFFTASSNEYEEDYAEEDDLQDGLQDGLQGDIQDALQGDLKDYSTVTPDLETSPVAIQNKPENSQTVSTDLETDLNDYSSSSMPVIITDHFFFPPSDDEDEEYYDDDDESSEKRVETTSTATNADDEETIPSTTQKVDEETIVSTTLKVDEEHSTPMKQEIASDSDASLRVPPTDITTESSENLEEIPEITTQISETITTTEKSEEESDSLNSTSQEQDVEDTTEKTKHTTMVKENDAEDELGTTVPEEEVTILSVAEEHPVESTTFADSVEESVVPTTEAEKVDEEEQVNDEDSLSKDPGTTTTESSEEELTTEPLESVKEPETKPNLEEPDTKPNLEQPKIEATPTLESVFADKSSIDSSSILDEPFIPSVIPLDDPEEVTSSTFKSKPTTIIPIENIATTIASPTREDIEAGLSDDLYLSLSRPDIPEILPSKVISHIPEDSSTESYALEPSTSVYYTETVVTSTRLRTYTYVVTKLNGLETEVTSSTTVRPRVTTLTLTVPVTVTVTPTVESSPNSVPPVYSPQPAVGGYEAKDEEEGRRFNLATRVMSNGVEVIVAGPTPALRWENSNPQPTLTLSDTVVMLLPQEKPNEFVTKTCTTTFTYLSTITKDGTTIVSTEQQVVANTATEERHRKPGSETAAVTLEASPTLRTEVFKTTYTYLALNTDHPNVEDALESSTKVITNTVTAPQHYLDMVLEPSEAPRPETNTYLSTRVLEKTVMKDGQTRVETTSDTITQLIVTESAPPPRPTSVTTTLTALDNTEEAMTGVMKTYYITYTYQNTFFEKGSTVIRTNVATSTDVVFEKVPVKKTTTKSAIINPTPEPIQIFATKTLLTTFTYFTTLLQGGLDGNVTTTVSSRSHVVQNVVTESITPSVVTEFTNALLTSAHHSDPVKNVVTGSTIIFFDEADQIDPSSTASFPEATMSVESNKEESSSASPAPVSATNIHSDEQADQPSDQDGASNNTTSANVSEQNKHPPSENGGDLQVSNLLNFGSLGINSLSALGPVITAMAGLLQGKTTPTRRNDTVLVPDVQEVTTQRSPIYIPVADFADGDIEAAESQNIAAHLANHNYLTETRHKVASSLADGIPISPGEVITANSDVIIGKPGKMGPRPPTTLLKNENHGMKPPPLPVPNIPVHPVLEIVDDEELSDSEAQHSHKEILQILPAHQVYEEHLKIPVSIPFDKNHQAGSRPPQKLHPIQSTPSKGINSKNDILENDPLLKPPNRPNVEQYANPNYDSKVPERNAGKLRRPWSAKDPLLPPSSLSLSTYDKIHPEEPNEKPRPTSTEDRNRPPWAQKDPLLPDESIVLQSSESQAPPSELIIHQVPHVIDRSTGQPLLVNIQPSQVANVVIPQGGTQALIFGDTNEPHISGQYFDDPSPYPEPEVGPGFIGIEKVEDLPQYSNEKDLADYMVPPSPPIGSKNQQQKTGSSGRPLSPVRFDNSRPQENSESFLNRPEKRPSDIHLIQRPDGPGGSSGQGHVHTEILVHHRPEMVDVRPQSVPHGLVHSHSYAGQKLPPVRGDFSKVQRPSPSAIPPRRSEVSTPTDSPHQYIFLGKPPPGNEITLNNNWKSDKKPPRITSNNRPRPRPPIRPSYSRKPVHVGPPRLTTKPSTFLHRPLSNPSRYPEPPRKPTTGKDVTEEPSGNQYQTNLQERPLYYPADKTILETQTERTDEHLPTGAIEYHNPSDPKMKADNTRYYSQTSTSKPSIQNFGQVLLQEEYGVISTENTKQTEETSFDSDISASENIHFQNNFNKGNPETQVADKHTFVINKTTEYKNDEFLDYYNSRPYELPVVQGKPFGVYNDQVDLSTPYGYKRKESRPDYEIIQGVPNNYGEKVPAFMYTSTLKPNTNDDTIDLKPPAIIPQFGLDNMRPGRPSRPHSVGRPETRPIIHQKPEIITKPVAEVEKGSDHGNKYLNSRPGMHVGFKNQTMDSGVNYERPNWSNEQNVANLRGPQQKVTLGQTYHEDIKRIFRNKTTLHSGDNQSGPNNNNNRPDLGSATRVHPEYPHILTKPKPKVPGPITISSDNTSSDKNGRPNIRFSMPVEAIGEGIDSKTQTERPPSMLITKDNNMINNKKHEEETLETAYQTNFASSNHENNDGGYQKTQVQGRPIDLGTASNLKDRNVPSRDMMPPPLRTQLKKDAEEGLKPPPPPSADVLGMSPPSADVLGMSPPPVDITTTHRPVDDRFTVNVGNESGLKPPPKYIPLKETGISPSPPSTSMVPPSPKPSISRPFLMELLSQDMIPPPPVPKTTRPLEITTVRPAVAVSGSIQIATAVATSHIPVVQDMESKIPIVHGTVDLPVVVDVPDIFRPVETKKMEHVSIYTVRPFDTKPIVSRISIQPTLTITSSVETATKSVPIQVESIEPSKSSATRKDVHPTRVHSYEIPPNPVKRPEHPVFLESSYENTLTSTRMEATETLSHIGSTEESKKQPTTTMKEVLSTTDKPHVTSYEKSTQANDKVQIIPTRKIMDHGKVNKTVHEEMSTIVTRVDSSITKVTNTLVPERKVVQIKNETDVKATKKILGTVMHEVIRNNMSATSEMKSKEVTRFTTSTVTRTRTSVLGSPPTTRTLLVTHTMTSTTIETVTETFLRPTSVVKTITSTILQSMTRIPTAYENVGENDSIFVVMSDQNPPEPGAEEVEAEYGEEDITRDEQDPVGNEIQRVLAGGVLGAAVVPVQSTTEQCIPECRASKSEVCAEIGNEMRCVCRPGFSRMFLDRPCKPTYTYTLRVGLDRIGHERIAYDYGLNDTSSAMYTQIASPTKDALDRTLMQSDLRDVYRGLKIAGFSPNPTKVDFHVQLSDNANETRLKQVLRKYLVGSNYSLGGTEVYASRDLDMIEAMDFDECTTEEDGPHHDCSPHATCFNLRGSYQCSCKEGWADLSENPAYPGRVCSQAPLGCASCNNKGHCVTNTNGQEICECFPWHSGQRCQVNLKVLLIALVTTGAILLGLLAVCLGLACFRPGRSRKTGDRRAMIPGTGGDTSSEGSVTDLAIPHHVPHVLPPPPQMIAPLPPSKRPARKVSTKPRQPPRKATMIPATAVPANDEQRDRSLTVMIPRAKYRSAPQSPQNYKTGTSTFAADEHKLINYLDNGPHQAGNRKQSISSNKDCKEAELQVVRAPVAPTGALVSAGFQVSATVTRNIDAESTLARSYGETTVEAATKVLRSNDFQGDLCSTLARSCGETTIQTPTKLLRVDLGEAGSTLARSCGETTIQPPTKIAATRRNSVKDTRDIRDSASEGHTMAERDLGSTLRLPAQHPPLYSPDRTSDRESNFDSL